MSIVGRLLRKLNPTSGNIDVTMCYQMSKYCSNKVFIEEVVNVWNRKYTDLLVKISLLNKFAKINICIKVHYVVVS